MTSFGSNLFLFLKKFFLFFAKFLLLRKIKFWKIIFFFNKNLARARCYF